MKNVGRFWILIPVVAWVALVLWAVFSTSAAAHGTPEGDETRTDEWVRIPNDVIHTEEDEAEDAKMKNKMSPQLRTEGVLFIYNGLVTCFWPPEEGG